LQSEITKPAPIQFLFNQIQKKTKQNQQTTNGSHTYTHRERYARIYTNQYLPVENKPKSKQNITKKRIIVLLIISQESTIQQYPEQSKRHTSFRFSFTIIMSSISRELVLGGEFNSNGKQRQAFMRLNQHMLTLCLGTHFMLSTKALMKLAWVLTHSSYFPSEYRMTPDSVFCAISKGAAQLAGAFAQTGIRQSISIQENENLVALFKASVAQVQAKPQTASLKMVWGSVLGLTSIDPATHVSAAIGGLDDRVKHLIQLAVRGNSVRMLMFKLMRYEEGIRFLQEIGLLGTNYPLENGRDGLVRMLNCQSGVQNVTYIFVPLTSAKRQAVLANNNANDAVALSQFRHTFPDLPSLIRNSPVAHGWRIPTVWGRATRSSNSPIAILKSWWLLMLCVKRRFNDRVSARVNDVLREVCAEWLCYPNQQVNYICALNRLCV
jgi:hypothetical protein